MSNALSAPAGKRYFESLDLIRGLAALLVLIYHVDFMFGLRDRLLPSGYLAVDLFFVLSGFVLSLTYGAKVAANDLGFREYLVARLARLYPLFFVTTAVGCAVMTARYAANAGYVDTRPLVESAVANFLMLPSFSEAYGSPILFPFNAATWSIFFEMLASLLFFVLLARMASTWLIGVATVAGIWLVGAIFQHGTVDVGWGVENFAAGFPRVLFSFSLGMLIHRRYREQPWQTPTAVLYGLLAIGLGLIQLALFLSDTAVFDSVAVCLYLPLLVAAGAGAELGPRAKIAARILGESSYSVYLTQGSLIIIAAGLSQAVLHTKIVEFAPLVGFVFVPAAVAFSFCTYRWFEDPARRFLRRFGAPKKASSLAATQLNGQ